MKETFFFSFCAALLVALPASRDVIKVLPYLQAAAASAAIVNNGMQMAERLNSK